MCKYLKVTRRTKTAKVSKIMCNLPSSGFTFLLAVATFFTANTNITNLLNAISAPVCVVGPSRALNDIKPSYPDDPSMPHLEDIFASPSEGIFTNSSYDDKGVVIDFNNLETTINTRSKVKKNSKAHSLVSYIQKKQRTIIRIFNIDCLLFRKKAIGTKWVYRNKKDERGVVVRNKARLVAQVHRQEEGIDYDEVFAPVARIEAIRIILAFASYMGFIVYQMDVKSAFRYGTIDEEVKQKEDGTFISQDKYVAKILKKFNFLSMKTTSTPIETQKPLVKDEEAANVDVYLYRSTIGSFMYLTASRPGIMFAVCACSRFQVTLKTSHLQAMKRILRRLISWQCKKADYCGYFYKKAEYVAVAHYVNTPRCDEYSLELKALMVFFVPIYVEKDRVGVNAAKPAESEGFKQMIDFLNGSSVGYALTASPTIRTSCIKLFWSTTKVKTVNDEVRVHALIDEKRVNIKESFIRRTLKLDDEEGTSCLANDELFTVLKPPPGMNLAALWRQQSSVLPQTRSLTSQVDHQLGDMFHHQDIYDNSSLTKKVFANMKRVGTSFSRIITPLFENMLVPAAEEVGKAQDDVSIPTEPSTSKPHKKYKSKKQQLIAPKVPSLEPSLEHQLPLPSNDPIPTAKDSLKLQKLMDLCIRLSNKFLDLESEVIDIKSSFTDKIEKLEDRVHKLEEENRILKEKSFKSAKIDIVAPVEGKEESFKQGRMIADMDEDVEVNLEEAQAKAYNLDLQHSEKVLSMQDIDEEEPVKVEEGLEVVTATKLITKVVTTAEPTTTVAQVPKSKDKGKGILIKEPKPLKGQAQIKQDEVFARQLEAELKANINWNDVIKQVKRSERQNNAVMREDLETLWKIVKERFKTTEPKNFSDDFLLNILKIMFEKPNIEANIYPLTHFTLERMLNNVRLEVKEKSEMSLELLRLEVKKESKTSLELLRLVRRQLNEGSYVKLDCNMEEFYKALIDQLDWNNHEELKDIVITYKGGSVKALRETDVG
nr:hypothetical protein [Tanacetum cinerariifolium]